jgi:uncharacterized Fe-S center protein
MSDVYFLPVEVREIDPKRSLLARYEKLLKKLITKTMVERRQVAIKLHLGGRFGYSQIHPAFVTRVVERVKECGGNPFVTDHRTGNRLAGAMPATYGCPVYHATGLKDKYLYTVKTGSRLLPKVEVAGYLYDADVLINLSHAKGHGQCGFGGAIKNLGMGAVSGHMRGAIHGLMDKAFRWHAGKCTHCRKCVEICEHKAIEFSGEGKDAKLQQDSHFCTLCLHCMMVCPTGAITVGKEGWPRFQKGLALATKAVLDSFEKGRMLHVNVALNITAICDCFGFSLPNIRPDVGILASTDPVALDAASIDAIDADAIIPGSLPRGVTFKGEKGHVLERIWGKDPYEQVRAGEELGMGKMKYTLRKML